VPCQPSGQCRVRAFASGDGDTNVYCYSNGVKQRQAVDSSGDPMHLIFEETLNGALCFSIEATATRSSNPGRADYVFRDGDGNQVATGTLTSDDGALWVTCEGGAPAQISTACRSIATPFSGCETGPCEY
jgi:hypothetical protein